jgi:hypothetical protein
MVMFNKLVRIGPVLIHQRKTLASYINLPFSMIKHNPRLSGVLVSGSDGEKPLKMPLRLLHMMNVHFSLLNMVHRILGVTLPNF